MKRKGITTKPAEVNRLSELIVEMSKPPITVRLSNKKWTPCNKQVFVDEETAQRHVDSLAQWGVALGRPFRCSTCGFVHALEVR